MGTRRSTSGAADLGVDGVAAGDEAGEAAGEVALGGVGALAGDGKKAKAQYEGSRRDHARNTSIHARAAPTDLCLRYQLWSRVRFSRELESSNSFDKNERS